MFLNRGVIGCDWIEGGEELLEAPRSGFQGLAGGKCQLLTLLISQVREFANHLQQLQGAFNDLIEEHSKASQEWAEKQAHLESELSTALQDKVTLSRELATLSTWSSSHCWVWSCLLRVC